MQSITSRENSYYKLAKSLQSPKGRKENGLYAIEGAKLIEEALEMRQRFHSAAFAFDKTEKHQGVIRLLEESSIPVYAMPGAMMESVCGTETPQGAFALLHAPSFDLPDDLLQLGTKTVTLDGVQDPGNVGTIMRTAQAFGAGSVVLGKGCASPLNPKVVRSCMGAIFRIPVYETDDIADLLAALKNKGYTTIAGHVQGNEETPACLERCALVIGNEARGVSPGVEKQCSVLWRLPMPGSMESLNASVAAGVMMYELFVREK